MATNFRPFSSTALRLHTGAIGAGDTLIEARWDHSIGSWAEVEWTVSKVLKNRLVLTRTVTRMGAQVELTKRMLVHNSKTWTGQNGEVQTREEGQSEWNHDSTFLFTPDDEHLIAKRAEFVVLNARYKARLAVRMSVGKIATQPRNFTPDDALEAIAALQAFVTAHKEN